MDIHATVVKTINTYSYSVYYGYSVLHIILLILLFMQCEALSGYSERACLLTQGRSHQNLSGQVEIISQASTYIASDFQIIVIVMHSIYYRV